MANVGSYTGTEARRGNCRRLQEKCLMNMREKSSRKSMDLCWLIDSGETGIVKTSVSHTGKWS